MGEEGEWLLRDDERLVMMMVVVGMGCVTG